MNLKKNTVIHWICFVVVLIVLFECAITFQKHSTLIIKWINSLGWLAPVLFVLTYCMATIMFLPTMVLTLAGGALFGPVYGTALNLLGATWGAACAFLITRHLLYDRFEQKKGVRINKLIEGVNQKGWIFVALVRLFPIIPFNLVNYGMGITGIKFRLYLITTFIFLIPAEIIYTYCGYVGMDALSNPGSIYKNAGIILFALALIFILTIKLIQIKKSGGSFSHSRQVKDRLPE